jgi:hypothetical protein
MLMISIILHAVHIKSWQFIGSFTFVGIINCTLIERLTFSSAAAMESEPKVQVKEL